MMRWCYLLLCVLFFFFKQKTAYEMRISDWSSDVCSSDLADRAPLDAPEAAEDVARMRRLHLEEIALVDRLADQFVHVIGLVRRWRDQRVEAFVGAVIGIARRAERHAAAVVLGQIVEEVADAEQRLDIIFERQVGD